MFNQNEHLHQIMYDRLGVSWYEKLKDFIDSEAFNIIRTKLLEDSDTNIIYPPAAQAYRAFKLSSYDRTNVVVLGQDPYHDGIANGLSFSTTGKISPSLRVILKAMQEELSPIYSLRSTDFSDLAAQGVLLLNTALSVKQKQPGSHIALWKPFTDKVVQTLFEKDKLIWMLWGTHALGAVGNVPSGHEILYSNHPAAQMYNPKLKFTPGFSRVNEILKKWNKDPIEWMEVQDDLPF